VLDVNSNTNIVSFANLTSYNKFFTAYIISEYVKYLHRRPGIQSAS